MPARTEANRKTNIGIARTVPVLLLGAIGYASWVFTKVICIDYLIHPPAAITSRQRQGSAIAILVIYYILLVILLVAYGRLLDTVTRRPGLIPRGPQWYAENQMSATRRKSSQWGRNGRNSEDEKSTDSDGADPKTPKEIQVLANETLPFRVQDFWHKDVFVCNPDGRPPFCSICYNWKPDRSHHCSEYNRCVLKFDHFCPWVGGVVSETSFKFFIQFTFYAALYTLHILVVTAYFFAERHRQTGYVNAHWIVVLALAGLFLLFSAGMCMSTGQFAFINSTTIENLNRKTKVWHLAVYVSPEAVQEAHEKGIALQLISYPRPPGEQLGAPQQQPLDRAENSDRQGNQASENTPIRMFAILESEPGDNPFDIGYLRNFQDIMGYTVWEWLLPVKLSPCFKHDNEVSLYKLGPSVDAMKAKTGLSQFSSAIPRQRSRRKQRRREERTMHEDQRS